MVWRSPRKLLSSAFSLVQQFSRSFFLPRSNSFDRVPTKHGITLQEVIQNAHLCKWYKLTLFLLGGFV